MASKTPAKTPTKKPAARKAVTAARSATARGKTAEPLEGKVIADEVGNDPVYAKFAEVADEARERLEGGYYRPDREDVEVSPGLSFTSTVKDREAEGVGEERVFEVDGETYIARRPVDDAFVLLSTAAASSTPMADRVASILEFLAEVVDEGDQIRLRTRLKDPADNFAFTDLLDIMETVVGTFSRKGPKQARAMAAPPRR